MEYEGCKDDVFSIPSAMLVNVIYTGTGVFSVDLIATVDCFNLNHVWAETWF